MNTDVAHKHNEQLHQQELEKRVPKTGVFNEVMIPAVSATAFGMLGFWVGKVLGRFGDDTRDMKQVGRFETGFKFIGAASFGLMAAAVAIRQTRESKQQAVELAKKTLELEQHNAALASVATKPVGTLVGEFDTPVSVVTATEVGARERIGTVVAPVELARE